jgi:hypothetical protein
MRHVQYAIRLVYVGKASMLGWITLGQSSIYDIFLGASKQHLREVQFGGLVSGVKSRIGVLNLWVIGRHHYDPKIRNIHR